VNASVTLCTFTSSETAPGFGKFSRSFKLLRPQKEVPWTDYPHHNILHSPHPI